MKYNICSLDNIVDLCKELLGSLKIEMIHKNNMEYKEELLQSIFIIIKEILDYLLFHKEWEYIYNTIIELKQHPNINPKLRFKCMDITDFVKNHMR
jgi:predicted RNA methylase